MCQSGYAVTDIAQLRQIPPGGGGRKGGPPGLSAFLQSWTSGTKVSSSQGGAEVQVGAMQGRCITQDTGRTV